MDTRPEAEQVQIALLQKATVAQRLAMTCALSRTAMELSRRALRRARPGASEREIELEFVALCWSGQVGYLMAGLPGDLIQ